MATHDSEFDPDADWKPNGRPQSTLARSFEASLHDIFKIDTGVENLASTVDQKKQAVTTQSQELEALEKKLKETEELLKRRQSRRIPPHPRSPLNGNFSKGDGSPTSPMAPDDPSPRSRPPTSKASGSAEESASK
ncbi:MAG: hypothetical protein M1834_003203 [Cirrosporium novae-zelandiae]|nr:MAG: hypothetical protein M1834_003203 [Cirrosporium novae-zelandiae]